MGTKRHQVGNPLAATILAALSKSEHETENVSNAISQNTENVIADKLIGQIRHGLEEKKASSSNSLSLSRGRLLLQRLRSKRR